MKTIGGHFDENVIAPLYEHLCKGRRCAALFRDLVAAFGSGKATTVEKLATEIDATESQADAIKFGIRRHLTRSIFATVRRAHILEVVRHQDKICDRAEDAANLIIIRATVLPPPCADAFTELAEKALDTVDALYECIHDIIAPEEDTNSSHKAYAEIIDALEKVHAIERASDDALHEFSKVLFAHESDTDLISVMLLFDIAGMISHIADAAENAAHSYSALLSHT